MLETRYNSSPPGIRAISQSPRVNPLTLDCILKKLDKLMHSKVNVDYGDIATNRSPKRVSTTTCTQPPTHSKASAEDSYRWGTIVDLRLETWAELMDMLQECIGHILNQVLGISKLTTGKFYTARNADTATSQSKQTLFWCELPENYFRFLLVWASALLGLLSNNVSSHSHKRAARLNAKE
uniref:Uncharacterized protein n=1 Tax=Glossina pallidipes TaxID=7398 RepID=A0A1A9ZL29_GLOPL